MSSFKKRNKSGQKRYRERGQPSERKHLGLLEKHKDYVERAASFKKKAAELKRLHEKARNRNKDEFYYKMIKTKLQDGRHVIQQEEESYTEEQLKIMKTQDLKYVQLKLSTEKSKIDRLRASLHQTEEREKHNTHLIFVDDEDEADSEEELESRENETSTAGEDDMDDDDDDDFQFKDLSIRVRKRSRKEPIPGDAPDAEGRYKELESRLKRCQELKMLSERMQLQKHLLNKKEKRVKERGGGRTIYKWLPERKR
ncbi:PREDICTED: probable U3 small nucleolar RNA-associated protein 11 [Amphimedon queenslandica]|uniref:U3 small nucleolar RNA-associated protein 11 n=1 Tax=Amphimedon queenslandica TaxID=400682 RepID=A0A1X7UZY8_AMPQE|nr:PREDICTED: probable U3 small nucleolar RNA-associated protein 11 [Amphimedon queenslandica]|eukprot:XP_003386213.1 PREDICTED: probable U3 small nucleolar RNA-associated protein 11 [Amphimedon queenslandica]